MNPPITDASTVDRKRRKGKVWIYRALLDQPATILRDPLMLQLWVYFLLRATYKTRSVQVSIGRAKRAVVLQPGQLITGIPSLAKFFNAPDRSVRRKIGSMMKMGSITYVPGSHFSIITIPNWGVYQAKKRAEESADPSRLGINGEASCDYKSLTKNDLSDANETACGGITGEAYRRKHGDIQEKVSLNKGVTNTANGFAEWWKVYPKRVKKIAALDAYLKALKRIQAERHIEAASAIAELLNITSIYAQAVAAKERRYIPHPASWLNAGSYDDDQSTWKETDGHRNGTNNGHASPARIRSGEYGDPAAYGSS